jgi:hypothetical protein
MSKRPISVTLDEKNLLWLRGRTVATGLRSVSEALDRLVAEARTSPRGESAQVRSVVGTIDIAESDPLLRRADAAVREVFDESLRRPIARRERVEPGKRKKPRLNRPRGG